ncbi:GEVED domain-containing protein [Hanstruepera ponticola]|uniref:GEVED domain-containing protein n=1 Tax=Hanstruepera ponticola TaxID=2042995 RepID=UPI000CF10EA1|nr:GEVED domain-containing protein [Hanstruepera ponticola]
MKHLFKLKFLHLICLIGISSVSSQTTLISNGSAWSYYDLQNQPADQGSFDWNDSSYDDSSWSSGNAHMGYGDGDEATVVNSSTLALYVRHSFNVADPTLYDSLSLNLTFDDGAVVYLNGVEVWRQNMPAGTPFYGVFASSVGTENGTASTSIANSLVVGTNVLAVEIHQESAGSSDISFDFELEALATSNYLLAQDEVWKYYDLQNEPANDGEGDSWIESDYNDASWASGNAELGYGDGDEATAINNTTETAYFRKTINIPDASLYNDLLLEAIRDDGMIVYINGVEVWRDNMDPGAINYNTFANSVVGGTAETTWISQAIASNLVNGNNVIAVEIHQENAGSSDISFNFRIQGFAALPSEVIRGPYLQSGTSTSVIIKWRTNTSTESIVNYGTSLGALTSNVTDNTPKINHELAITGLTPNTKYFFDIADSDGVYMVEDAQMYIKTAPPIGTDQFVRAWILGDAGTANQDQRDVRDQYYTYVQNATTNPDFTDMMLFLGDNAYNSGTDTEYQAALFDIYGDMLKKSVAWSTLGNHDGYTADSDSQTGNYYDIFTFPTNGEAGGLASGTEAYYSFDYANIHFIVLESYETDRSVGGAMYNWAQNDIQNTTQDWIVALWHHPPYTKGSHNSDTETELIEMRENFLPMLESNGVDLVLSGHSHSYERSYFLNGHYDTSGTFNSGAMTVGANGAGDGKTDGNGAYSKSPSNPDGAVYITTGSAGKISGGNLNHNAMYASLNELGSCVLEVSGTTLNLKFIRETGAITDYFTIQKGCTATVPTGLAVSNITENSATVTWDDVSGATYDVRYREVGSPTWITNNVSSTSTDLTGLNNLTDYEVQVRSVCDVGVNSAYTSSELFTTLDAAVCSPTVPTGLSVSNIAVTTATVSWNEVVDTTYDLRYREVGSFSWTTNNVSTLSSDLTNLISLTEYEVQVRSVCDVGTSSDYSSSVFFTTLGITTCTGTEISSFPYLETFDSGAGDWTQATGDNGNWTLNSGGTPTNSTGPSNDITGGGNYFYTEAHDIGTNNSAIIVSPCYDLSNLTVANFSFNYHMYGSTMGSLNLEITTDNGSNWTNIFTRNGNLGNQWNSQTINLNSYTGQTVKFRFIGTIGNGGQRRSDMAIDQIQITGPTYCASNGNNTNNEYISRVQLNTLDNNSGVGTTSTGYSNFTGNTALRTNLSATTQYTITITPTWTGASSSEGYSVWIDYNGDGDFADTGEQVWSLTPTDASPVSGTFTVPTDIHYGSTRMRVSMKNNAIPSACESFSNGEVEDYAINLVYDGLLYLNDNWIPNAPSGSTGSENALVLSGTYSVTNNVQLNNLTIINGATVDIQDYESVVLNGDLTNNGELILNSISDQYASLIVNGTVTGDVVYKRHVNINAGGNDLVSAPLTGQTFGDFANMNSNIFSNPSNTSEKLFGPFDKASGSYLTYDTDIPAEAAVVLEPAVGYRAASSNNSTFEFRGTVNTGTVNINILHTANAFPEWNLIGNPYPSYIKLSDFLNANITEFLPSSAAIYGYDGNASDGWKILNLAYSLANPNAIIAPGQGFLVSSKIGGGTMVFNSSMRTIATGDTNLDDDYIEGRTSNRPDAISFLNLQVSNSSNIYKTDFYFTDNASLGLNIGYDAEVYGGSAPSFAIYSHLVQESEGIDMAIQSLSFNDLFNNLVIPLGINTTQGDPVTVEMLENTLPDDVEVYLEDNVTNTFTLLNNNNYQFTANSNLSDIGRFFLHFESATLGINENTSNTVQIFATSSPKEVIINGMINSDAVVTLIDTQGREVLKKSIKSNLNRQEIDVSNLSSGVYIVQLKSNTQNITQKVIIK